MKRVSIIIPTCRPDTTLRACLAALARMNCDFAKLEVIAVVNGETTPRADFARATFPFRLVVDHIRRANISAAKNRAVDLSSGEILVLINDDTLVEPDFLSAHLAAHAGLDQPAMVLGHSAWRRYDDETIFDRLIAETSMIFFYHRMTPRRWYGFRHAWNLNLSIRREYALEERFDERFHYSFEDVEWAFRLETGHDLRVWYEPDAVSLHDHRYTLDGYLKRERQHGQVAVRSWDVNSDCFRAVYGRHLDRSLINYYRAYVENEGRHESEALERFRRVVARSASFLDALKPPSTPEASGLPPHVASGRLAGRGSQPDPRAHADPLSPARTKAQSDFLHALYDAHLPLKRLAFRRGFIEALQTGKRPDSFAAITTDSAPASQPNAVIPTAT